MVDLRPKGSLQVPLLVALFIISIGFFGVWGVLRHWSFLMQTQLRLDRCVGEAAQSFRDDLNSIFKTNRKIGRLRKAIVVAQVAEPASVPALQLVLEGLAKTQDLKLLNRKRKSVQWLLLRGCGGHRDWPNSLPSMDFVRPPPDTIGSNELQWEGVMPPQFRIQLKHSPRAAAAQVEKRETDEKWTANWAQWTNFN